MLLRSLSFEIILSSRIKVPSKSVTYNVFIIELFYPFRNHNIHAMLMRDSAAIAVKNNFFCFVQFPIMIEHKKFSGSPAKPVGILIRRNCHKRFIYKYIDCMYAVSRCVFFQVCGNFVSYLGRNKVKHATAKNNVIVVGCAKISYVSSKEVYTLCLWAVFFSADSILP